MSKYLVCIDPGHGGSDPGAVYGNLKEKDIVLPIALEVNRLLKLNEINTVLTRDKDIFVDLNSNRTPKCDISVSIHVNSGGGQGLETWVSLFNQSAKSKKLGQNIQDNVLESTPFKNRGLKTRSNKHNTDDYLYMIRKPKGVPVLVECGFIDNANDRNIMQNYQNEIAKGIVKGICQYLGVDFKLNKKDKISEWAKEAWEWGKKNNITDGSRPKDAVTREELLTMLHRFYIKLK